MTWSEAIDHTHEIGATIVDITRQRGGGRIEVRMPDGRYETILFAWAQFTPRRERAAR
jgi:hypothetical protein